MNQRAEIVGQVADHLIKRELGHPLRVAVDGITAAGKTTLANELATAINERGRTGLRLSMDGFHHRRAHRHRQGRDSSDGYYEDAYDFHSFVRLVLAPLGPAGDGWFRQRIIDLASDEPIDDHPVHAAADAVLVVDGSFLQRGELAGCWDQIVFVNTSFDLAKSRGSQRDAKAFDGVANAARAFDNRYHAACRRYLAEVGPAARADIVVDNDDVERPTVELR